MAEINLQCNNLSQTHSSVFFRLKIVGEPSLAEIHQEMSELLDKQVNAQKEKTSGVHVSSREPTKKCAMKMKETNKEKKNDARVKIIFMEGSPL